MMLRAHSSNRRRWILGVLGTPMLLLPAPGEAGVRRGFVRVEVHEESWRSFLDAARDLDRVEDEAGVSAGIAGATKHTPA